MLTVYELWIVMISLLVLKLCHSIYQWRNPKCNGNLPPGSMGFPIIGETFEFMKPHDALQFPSFVKKKTIRHGPVFRTSLFGGKVIISMDNELNMEMAKTNRTIGVPKSITRLFGNNNLFVQSIDSHKHVRSLTFQLLGPQGLRLRLIEDIDLLTRTHMKEGAMKGFLDVKETSSKARKRMMNLLKEVVLKKRASGEEFGEFFKIIFGEKEGGKEKMSVEDAIDYIYTFFLIANETTPRILAATVKLISEKPTVMRELQREHARILGDRADKDAGLTWEDYKSMTFTHMVINESLRITTTVPVVLRKPDHDIQVGDYTIPAGWTFMGYPNVHFNPEKYEDPLVFNPWRWKGKDLSALVTKNYIPFGAGPRLCVGAYFAKLLMAVFIHNLCRYRWSMKAETTVTRSYMLMFPFGCDVQFSEDTEGDKTGG
ncbi:hypothetical protein Bca4012_060768 [Brassica carinata]